jgi:hypothetical protein
MMQTQVQAQARMPLEPGVWDYEAKRAVCPSCGLPVSFSGKDCRKHGRVMSLDDAGVRIRYLYCRCGAPGFKALPKN